MFYILNVIVSLISFISLLDCRFYIILQSHQYIYYIFSLKQSGAIQVTHYKEITQFMVKLIS